MPLSRFLSSVALWLAIAVSGSGAEASTFPALRFLDRAGKTVPDVVALAPGARAAPASGTERAIMDQRNKRFVPHVLAVDPGTVVSFPNSDDTRHHVYSFSPARTFELKLYRANEAPPVPFPETGLVKLGCNIHDSMKGYILVTEVSARAVADQRGKARLPLAPGVWPERLEIWHPQLERRQTLVTPAPGEVGPVWTIELPLTWHEPQPGKSETELEKRLKQFRAHGD